MDWNGTLHCGSGRWALGGTPGFISPGAAGRGMSLPKP